MVDNVGSGGAGGTAFARLEGRDDRPEGTWINGRIGRRAIRARRRSGWLWLLVPIAARRRRVRPFPAVAGRAGNRGGAGHRGRPSARGPARAVNPWREAAKRVEENRGEPMGRAARVHVPAELRHYADKRRFLAIQVAAWREKNYELPHDEAELAGMIERGEMVEVPSLGEHHILYGVGANATGEPLTHYDVATGQEIPLYPRYDVFDDAAAEWSADDRREEGRGRRGHRAGGEDAPDEGPGAAPARAARPRRGGRARKRPPSRSAARARRPGTTIPSGGGCSSRNGRSSTTAPAASARSRTTSTSPRTAGRFAGAC